jgi:hypothetical protein
VSLKKICLVVAHTKVSPGAFSQALHQYEYQWSQDFCQALCSVLVPDFDCQIFFRDGHLIQETYDLIDKWAPDLGVECHFNSEISGVVEGSETLVALHNQKFGTLVQNAIVIALQRFGRHDRGVQLIHPGDQQTRGWLNVTAPAWPHALIEPFFGSSQEDSDSFKKNAQAVCEHLKMAFEEWVTEQDPGWVPGK